MGREHKHNKMIHFHLYELINVGKIELKGVKGR